jgi:hypothetical protein
MSFRMVTIFEKPGAQVEAELWATPGFFKFSKCFVYDSNPYISKMDLKINEDGSYLEYYIEYHDIDAYRAWYDEWKHIHDDLRSKIIENLKSRGINSKIFWPEEENCPIGYDPVFSLNDFVSRITTSAS